MHELIRRLQRELAQYVAITTYLYVCFAAILLYKAAILHGEGIRDTPFVTALVKSLILAKFMFIGEKARIGERVRFSRIASAILFQSFAFLAFLIGLSVAEELTVGFFAHRPVSETVSDFAGGKILEILATALLMFLILLPYFTYRQLDRAGGEGWIRRLILERKPRAE